VTLESEPGAGSVFTVRLPLLAPASRPSCDDEPSGELSTVEQRTKGRRRAPRRGAKAIPPAEPA
jgi:hypothetical protein